MHRMIEAFNRLFEQLATVGIHSPEDLQERWKKIQEDMRRKRESAA